MEENTKCRKCKKDLEINAAALNKKYFGLKVQEFYCMACLAEGFGVTVQDLNQKIDYYKSTGCTLFC